jgi:lipopolysaccharide biosynthesis glycosyltransferase
MYHIAVAFDNQSDYSLVLIKNIVDKSESSLIYFHIFIGEFTDYSLHHNWLSQNNISPRVYRITESDLNGMHIDLNAYKHITNAAFYRLLMPSVLSNLDCFLYLDTDIYVDFDILEIFKHCPKNQSITVASEGSGFNSGMLLINPRRYNHELSLIRTFDLFNEHRFSGDNELLVHYFKDFNKVGLEYNRSAYSVVSQLPSQTTEENKVIHFMGTTKPWRYSTILPFAKEWRAIYYEIYKRNPWEKITIKEFLLRFLYLVFPNPKFLFQLHKSVRRLIYWRS